MLTTSSVEQCDWNDWSLYTFGTFENRIFDTGISNHTTPFSTDFFRGSYTLDSSKRVHRTLGDTGPQQFHSIMLTNILHARGIQYCFLLHFALFPFSQQVYHQPALNHVCYLIFLHAYLHYLITKSVRIKHHDDLLVFRGAVTSIEGLG